jgi:hypothetical protein
MARTVNGSPAAAPIVRGEFGCFVHFFGDGLMV